MSDLTWTLVEFSIIVAVLAAMTCLIASALIELIFRLLFNFLCYKIFLIRFIKSTHLQDYFFNNLRFMTYGLPYRQFCGRLSSIAQDALSSVEHEERGKLAEIWQKTRPNNVEEKENENRALKSKNDRITEEIRTEHLRVERTIDGFQAYLGTLWKWFTYYFSVSISVSLCLFLLGISASEGPDLIKNLDGSQERFLMIFGAILSGIIAPLGVSVIERTMASR